MSLFPINISPREQKPINKSVDNDNNEWNEKIRRFATYKPTPERKMAYGNQPQNSSENMYVNQQSFDNSQYQEQDRPHFVQFNDPLGSDKGYKAK